MHHDVLNYKKCVGVMVSFREEQSASLQSWSGLDATLVIQKWIVSH